MRLTRIYLLGRYTNPATGRPVNVYKGTRVGRGDDFRFYLFRQKRVLIGEADFFHTWKKV